jgi:NAD(P)-dependent dehydrogenase (short-subunit alcohol dehydrogenase family)
MTDRKVVLITGTRKGIGRFLVHHFNKGAFVGVVAGSSLIGS